jgi:predicted RNA-binding protein
MNHWLAISNKKNWEIIQSKNIWGGPKRNRNSINNVKMGDKITIYVSSIRKKNQIIPASIMGSFEVISNVFEDETPVFLSPKATRLKTEHNSEKFPYRIKLKPIKIFKEPLEFKPLVQKLTFIANKKYWMCSIRGLAIRNISEKDYNFIMNSYNKK